MFVSASLPLDPHTAHTLSHSPIRHRLVFSSSTLTPVTSFVPCRFAQQTVTKKSFLLSTACQLTASLSYFVVKHSGSALSSPGTVAYFFSPSRRTCSLEMNRILSFTLLIGSISGIYSSCFGNGTVPNSTASPCLVNGGAFLPNQLPAAVFPHRPSSPFYPQVYPYEQPYGYRTGPQFTQQQLPASNIRFPQPGYQTEYNPYYRPNDVSRLGYSYPAGYRGPEVEYNHNSSPYYNNYLGQPPPRYTLGHGHPNFSPVAPLFQRRTYAADHRQDHTKEPIFMDRGTVSFVGRDAELSCSFYDNRYRVVSVSSVQSFNAFPDF